jgi:hypothetical protein
VANGTDIDHCISCGADSDVFIDHCYIRRKRNVYWNVTVCPKCGNVQEIEEEPFSIFNIFPRSGRVKALIFFQILGLLCALLWGILFYKSARPLGIAGGFFLIVMGLIAGIDVYMAKITEVDDLPFKRWEKYPEFVRKNNNPRFK